MLPLQMLGEEWDRLVTGALTTCVRFYFGKKEEREKKERKKGREGRDGEEERDLEQIWQNFIIRLSWMVDT